MTALVRYETARRALAEAKTVDEVKGILDRTEAVRAYARQTKDRSLENDAREIRWRAQRRLGEMIVAEKAAGRLSRGGRPKTLENDSEVSALPKLEDLGVDHTLSKRAQKYAELDGDSFERLVARCRAYAAEHDEAAPLDILRAEEKQAKRDEVARQYAERTTLGCNVTDLEILAEQGKRFGVIYADPPWEFRVWSGAGKDRSADNHYKTGGLDAIKALPVEALAAENCALLMWAVMPELPGALEVIKAWGFQYKTVGFTWVKQNKSGEGLFWGMGYWTRANAEVCLLATKGKPERIAKDVHQVLLSPIMDHSRKPDEFHERIERLLPGPYLEVYARRPRKGWTVWGNEIPRESFVAYDAVDPETGEILDTNNEHVTETSEISQDSSPGETPAEEPAPDPLVPPAPIGAGSPSYDDLEIPEFLRRAG